jgi:hypothetical protein
MREEIFSAINVSGEILVAPRHATYCTFLLDYPPTHVTLRDKQRRLNVDDASDSEPILKNGKQD